MNETEALAILADWNFWGSYRIDARERTRYLMRLEEHFSERVATVVYGVRHAGKSTLTALFIEAQIAKRRFTAKDTLIVNFEDPRFDAEIDSRTLFQLYEIYIKHLVPESPVVVLDEVQNVRNWEKFVRYLLEAKKAYVIITGSSSKLLAREISTVLTGRHLDMEVLPLSFREYLTFHDVAVGSAVEMVQQRLAITRYLDEFAQWGGFPEVARSTSGLRKRELLTRYFEDILFKDIIKRFGIKELGKLENLANLLLANIATLQSFNKLKSRLGTSLDTVERFAKFFEMARMFFFVKKFDHSAGAQIRSINKVYIVDPGFYAVKGFKFTANFGRIAENLVAIELMRRRAFDSQIEIYYWKDYQQREVDFVVKKGQQVEKLLQVCWQIEDEKTYKREIRSLVKASAELHCDDLWVVTRDQESVEQVNWKGLTRSIRFVPLWRWLLSI